MGKKMRMTLSALMAGFLIAAGMDTAKADSYTGIGLEDNHDCSLQVTMVYSDDYNEAEKVNVSGAELTLVKVADLKTDGTYELVEPFENIDSWDAYVGGNGTAEDAVNAAASAAEAASEATPAAVAVTDENGTVVFNVSDYGIYLLYQTDKSGTAESYGSIQPVLVSIPRRNSDGTWTYDVKISPKFNPNPGTSVRIRKRAYENGQTTDEKVIGAKLEIVRVSDQAVMDEWTTTSVDHDSVVLAPGDYILIETEVPDGYQQADPIEFTVRDDGSIVVNGEVADNNEIIMNDPVGTEETPTPTPETPWRPNLPHTYDDTPENPTTVIQHLPTTNTGINAHPFAWLTIGIAACVLFYVIHKRRRNSEKSL
jgi:hypothetical protein